jgi:hypothetical protein
MTTLSQLACHGCLKAAFLLHGFPVTWLSCHGFLVTALLLQLYIHDLPTTCLVITSGHGCPVMFSRHGCLAIAVLSRLSSCCSILENFILQLPK